MTMPSSGTILMSQFNTELGNASSAQISLGGAAVRGLCGVASGQIKMSDGYGKSASTNASITISTNSTNYTLNQIGRAHV